MRKLGRILLAFVLTLALGEAFDLAYLSYVRATITTTASSTTLAGNGSTQVFTYSYVAGQASYIQVTYTNASGIATVLTPSQYTLTINAPATGQVWGIGGTVTYPTIASGQPPIVAGTTLTIARTVPLLQVVSSNGGQSFPVGIEQGLDLLEMQIQQIENISQYSLTGNASDPSGLIYSAPPVAARANLVMCWDGSGNVAACSTAPSGVISSAMTPVVSAATLALGRTAFGLGTAAGLNANCGLQSASGPTNLDVVAPIVTQSVSASITAANCNQIILTAASLTLTLPRASTLWNGFSFWVNSAGGTTTLALNSNDKVLNNSSGVSVSLAANSIYLVYTNGASSGTWYISAASPANWNAATQQYAFNAPAYFSGTPWADVRSGSNGCPAALGNGSNNDYVAATCQATYMSTTYAGGAVFFPCGTYNFAGNTLSVPRGVVLIGAGRSCAILQNTSDASVVSFPASTGGNDYNGLQHLTLYGYQNPGATNDVVVVGNNSATFISDATIFYGRYALNNCGIDGTIEDVFASGYTGGLISCGANWYIRVKFDGPIGSGVATTYAYIQSTTPAGATSAENHFMQCDFSGTNGNLWSDAVNINNATDSTESIFESSVIGSNVSLTSGFSIWVANELRGGSSFSIGSGATAVVSSNITIGGTLTIVNGGVLKCGINATITNSGC